MSKGLNFIVSTLSTIFPIIVPIYRPKITLWGTKRVYYGVKGVEEYLEGVRRMFRIIERYYIKKPLTRKELLELTATGIKIRKPSR